MVPPQRADTRLYPEEAKAAGVSGEVGIEVVVNEQGVVSDEGDPISATAR
jgi:outer membrane biosynthesis protein TonB